MRIFLQSTKVIVFSQKIEVVGNLSVKCGRLDKPMDLNKSTMHCNGNENKKLVKLLQ